MSFDKKFSQTKSQSTENFSLAKKISWNLFLPTWEKKWETDKNKIILLLPKVIDIAR